MQKKLGHLAFITCALLALTSVTFVNGQQSATPQPKRKIIIAKAGAELRTPKEIVWRAYLGEVFTVDLTNGEWLWIKEKQGWLWEKEAVDFDNAIEELSQRIKANPTAENYHLRGVAFLAHENYDNAIADFSESLRKFPRNAGALNNRGQASYLKGDYKSAITDYSGAVVMDPKHIIAFKNRALAYLETEELDLALADLQSALKVAPDFAEALNNRGIVYQKMQKYDQAISDFTAALKIDPQYTDALGNRAYSLQQKKEYSRAIADLELAMKNNPESYEAINDLAWLLATAEDAAVRSGARSLELATQACSKTDNKQWNMLDTLAAAYAEIGQWDKAKETLENALANAPEKEKPRLQGHLDLVIGQMPIRQ